MKKKYIIVGLFIILILIAYILMNKNIVFYNLPGAVVGDVNGDNKVSIDDYLLIRKHLLSSPALVGNPLKRADVDGKNGVTVADYVMVRKIILGVVSPTQTPTPTKAPTITPIPTKEPTPSPTPTPQTSSIVLAETYSPPSGFSVDNAKSYSSSTLKYKTIRKNDSTSYYSIVWVKDAYNQLNSANSNYSSNQRYTHLHDEIKNQGYQSKGMIAVNGSFTWNGRSNTVVIRTKGNSINNGLFVKQKADGTSLLYSTLTIGSDNNLKYNTFSDTQSANSWLDSVGARNTWAITHFKTSDWTVSGSDGADHRSAICQIDSNNFVLYRGYSGILTYMKELHDMFGCTVVVNLDGGGSSGMYYKTNSMSDIGIVYQYINPNECCNSSCGYKCRSVADMLYFVEK